MPRPLDKPVTSVRLPSRTPVIVIDGLTGATGVTAFDGSDAADQPAPVSAFTVKVYAVPFDKPATSQASAGTGTRQVRPPGDDVTR